MRVRPFAVVSGDGAFDLGERGLADACPGLDSNRGRREVHELECHLSLPARIAQAGRDVNQESLPTDRRASGDEPDEVAGDLEPFDRRGI